MNNKKQLLLSIGLVLILVLMIIGISYAAFQFIGQGSKVSTITSGIMKMSYTESDNIINLQGALPTTDETGKKRLTEGEYFDFTVSSTIQGSSNINWEIALEEIWPEDADRQFNGNYIKLYLTELDDDGNETPVVEPVILFSLDYEANKYTGKPESMDTLYTASADKSFNKKYRLRMWVDEKYNPQDDGGNLQFGVKVNVYGKTFIPRTGSVADVLLAGVGDNGTIDKTDSEQTFITGENPDNYIWYSGKLWRAVSIDPSDNSVKLMTDKSIVTIAYGAPFSNDDSYVKQWLNDTSVDGFLANLDNYKKFIKTDSTWNATAVEDITTELEKKTMVTSPVGLLNTYESTKINYLNESFGLINNDLSNEFICTSGGCGGYRVSDEFKINPVINLKSNIKVVSGTGTYEDPYILEGESVTTGTLLSTRYSGEYISFGTGENNLYRIVSHENKGQTKIVSVSSITNSAFDTNGSKIFSTNTTVGSFLNGEFLTSGEYLTAEQVGMIEDNTTWYLGEAGFTDSYKLAKYSSLFN